MRAAYAATRAAPRPGVRRSGRADALRGVLERWRGANRELQGLRDRGSPKARPRARHAPAARDERALPHGSPPWSRVECTPPRLRRRREPGERCRQRERREQAAEGEVAWAVEEVEAVV